MGEQEIKMWGKGGPHQKFRGKNPQALSQNQFGGGAEPPKYGPFGPQKWTFWTPTSVTLNPLTNTPFFAHFVVKSGPLGKFRGCIMALGLKTLAAIKNLSFLRLSCEPPVRRLPPSPWTMQMKWYFVQGTLEIHQIEPRLTKLNALLHHLYSFYHHEADEFGCTILSVWDPQSDIPSRQHPTCGAEQTGEKKCHEHGVLQVRPVMCTKVVKKMSSKVHKFQNITMLMPAASRRKS